MKAMAHAYAVRWKDSPRWDIRSARATVFRLANPTFRPLGEFAEEATELVRPWLEPEHEWPIYGINNLEGVFLSKVQKGNEFNAPYKRIQKDWFFHNPTRANVGSLGRVPEVPKDAITSPEYQVWRIRHGLLPEFVEILIKTNQFIQLIDCHRVGAVKERLFLSNLFEIPIPVVSESKQLEIASEWHTLQSKLREIRSQVTQLAARLDSEIWPAPATKHMQYNTR